MERRTSSGSACSSSRKVRLGVSYLTEGGLWRLHFTDTTRVHLTHESGLCSAIRPRHRTAVRARRGPTGSLKDRDHPAPSLMEPSPADTSKRRDPPRVPRRLHDGQRANHALVKQTDTVQFGHKLLKEEPSDLSKPASGCRIYGFFWRELAGTKGMTL